MTDHIQPLPSSLWFRRIEKIADGGLDGVEQSLRHAFHLLQITPVRFRGVVRTVISEDAFERLLAAEDLDAAARNLIGRPAELTVFPDDKEQLFRAAISCVIEGQAIHGAGPTIAEAILSAWTACLLALEENERMQWVNRLDQTQHTMQSEPDPRSA